MLQRQAALVAALCEHAQQAAQSAFSLAEKRGYRMRRGCLVWQIRPPPRQFVSSPFAQPNFTWPYVRIWEAEINTLRARGPDEKSGPET